MRSFVEIFLLNLLIGEIYLSYTVPRLIFVQKIIQAHLCLCISNSSKLLCNNFIGESVLDYSFATLNFGVTIFALVLNYLIAGLKQTIAVGKWGNIGCKG
jgi:hypothetical protein